METHSRNLNPEMFSGYAPACSQYYPQLRLHVIDSTCSCNLACSLKKEADGRLREW